MRIPVNWINDFTPAEKYDPYEIAHEATMTGSKVDEVIITGEGIKGVVSGKITDIKQHPNANKLVVCKVDVGGEELQTVTGADNMIIGDVVPVALDGSILPGNKKIKAGKLRGVESRGMLCSIQELGFEKEDFPMADADGIFILPKDTKPGLDIKQVLDLGRAVLDFDITPNRPDCFCVEGIAREVAITLGLKFKEKKPSVRGIDNYSAKEYLDVDVQCPEMCNRYVARMVKNVKIGPSPGWMSSRLRQSGLRPINNIVDITNYVLLELGQPMHAFDYDYLNEGKIIVRRAGEKEKIVTLDEETHELSESMLVIADPEKPVALAGVMGGENSQIHENTKTIVFESANFDGISTRLTAKKLGMRTESSARFEKGLDPENAKRAMDRACELVEILKCGEVSYDEIDEYPVKPETAVIEFRPDKINAFLGTDIPSETMTDILLKVGCTIKENEKMVHFEAPTYRPDIKAEADLCEEIARFYGYNKIAPTLLSGKSTTLGGMNEEQKKKDTICSFFRSNGYYEACTYTFFGEKVFDKILLAEDDKLRNAVRILNPIGEDYSLMRTTMIPSLMDIVYTNESRGVGRFKVFETAKIYLPKKDGKNELPEEKEVIASVYSSRSEEIKSAGLFYEVKGEINELLRILGIKDIKYSKHDSDKSFHPGRTAKIESDGKILGFFGYIHPDVASNYEVSKNTVITILDFDKIKTFEGSKKTFVRLPKYPGISRDLALIADSKTTCDLIEESIKKSAGELLETIRLFDIYRGKQIGEDKKSLAYNLVFRSKDRTLKDDEVNILIENILKELKEQLNIYLR